VSRLSTPEPIEEVLLRSHTLLEGPRIARDGAILYSDVLAGGVFRVDPGGGVRTVVERRRGVGGLVEHERGGVVVSGRDLVHFDADGVASQLLERDGVTGFNDLTTGPDGELLVGALRYRPLAGEPPVAGELLALSHPGSARVLSETVLWPNGIGVAPDGQVYISDFARAHVKVLSLDGGRESVFCESPRGSADGLALDVEGGVWVALGAGGGVARFEPGGELDEFVEVPAAFVSSISFGGADGCDVLISTADNVLVPERGGALFRARSEVAGVPVRPATV
jgi:gluconolactonase